MELKKIRFVNWYDSVSSGRNDGNPLYVTAALKRMSIYGRKEAGLPINESEINQWLYKEDLIAKNFAHEWVSRGIIIDIDHLAPYASLTTDVLYDFNIWVDWGEDGLGGILPEQVMECPKPMIYWASDTHLGYDYRLAMAKKADYVFCAQRKATIDFKKDGIANPIWLPHAFEPLAYPKGDLISKKYDVCFVGHINSGNRIDALDRVFSEAPNFFYGQRKFEEAARKYHESKVVFNIAMKDDVNMRCFEAMGSGSFLLTDRIDSIDHLFIDGVDLVLYDSLDDMAKKLRYYIEHDDEREKIAASGYNKVISEHTILHRVNMMLNQVLGEKKNG